jgi:hypothetical protein
VLKIRFGKIYITGSFPAGLLAFKSNIYYRNMRSTIVTGLPKVNVLFTSRKTGYCFKEGYGFRIQRIWSPELDTN